MGDGGGGARCIDDIVWFISTLSFLSEFQRKGILRWLVLLHTAYFCYDDLMDDLVERHISRLYNQLY